jgi:MinD superfamily P-loop ATPase
MKTLSVLSGKGGTGKTSLVASFAKLAEGAVLADCDVDAADLHLILTPQVKYEETFSGGKRASVNKEACTDCGACEAVCRFGAVHRNGQPDDTAHGTYYVDPLACEGCGVCYWACEDNAIAFRDTTSGKVFVSDTRYGPMVHARLHPAEENSGKLVTRVRTVARDLAIKDDLELIILDGSPGIGCPVIASVTGADLVLVITEPTQSGRHDLERLAALTAFMRIPTVVCINKWDINPEITAEIENGAASSGLPVAGKVRYDPAFTAAQLMKSSIVEYTGGIVAQEVHALWRRVQHSLHCPPPLPAAKRSVTV